jgi:hypothetical protein
VSDDIGARKESNPSKKHASQRFTPGPALVGGYVSVVQRSVRIVCIAGVGILLIGGSNHYA